MSTVSRLRITVQAALCALVLMLSLPPSLAQAEEESIQFDIAAQPLSTALKSFAAQAKMQLLYRQDVVEGERANAVVGSFEKRSALHQLLKGTGLEIVFSADNAATIRTKLDVSANMQDASEDDSRTVRLVQVGQGDHPADTQNSSASGRTRLAQNQSSPSAAAGDRKPVEVGEIVVTAQKRGEQNIQDVPISISVLGGAELDASRADGINEVLKQVPGIYSYASQQGGMTKFAVRGVTSNNSLFNGASTVGYYLDEIPFGFIRFPVSPDANAYDLERVEVLRGPQGTLYGTNALNGVIRVITKDANMDEYELKVRTMASTTSGGGENYRGDLAVNAPLVPGKLGVRGVLGYGEYGGWIDQPATGREDINDAELKNFRFKVNAAPTENFGIEFLSWFSRDDRNAPPGENAAGQVTTDSKTPIDTRFDAYDLTLNYDFSNISVLSSTSYMDFSNFSIGDIGPDGLTSILTAELLSEEVRINSRNDGPWNWSVGGIYRDAEDRLVQRLPILAPGRTLQHVFQSKSFAIFGELSRKFMNDRFELTGGVRYFEDQTDFQELSDITSAPGTPLISSARKFDAVTPRLVLTWHPSEAASLYASYSEGFRSGFDQNALVARSAPGARPVNPDALSNYEIGAKGSAWQGRLSYDLATYYIDWKDAVQRLSVNVGVGGVPFFVALPINGETVSGVGVDAGLTVELIEGLNIGLSFSWNDLAFNADVRSNNVLVYEKGERLDESPATTAGASLNYIFPLSGGYEGQLSGSANYHTEMKSRSVTTGALAEGDDILSTRLSLSLLAPGGWSAMLFVDNLKNDDGLVNINSNRLQPRTVGVQLQYKY